MVVPWFPVSGLGGRRYRSLAPNSFCMVHKDLVGSGLHHLMGGLEGFGVPERKGGLGFRDTGFRV